MNRLDLEAINSRSPYDVHSFADQYVFVTDTGIEYIRRDSARSPGVLSIYSPLPRARGGGGEANSASACVLVSMW